MIQPRLAYAGVVELPQEVCQLPWAPAEETEKQPEYACDFSALELTTEERMEEELSLSEFIPSPVPDSLNAAQNESGKSQLAVKSSSSLDSDQEIAICFFQEASDPEETYSDTMDGNGATAGLDPDHNPPQVAQRAAYVEATSAMLSPYEQDKSVVLGNVQDIYLLFTVPKKKARQRDNQGLS